jgi:hypothetical protein
VHTQHLCIYFVSIIKTFSCLRIINIFKAFYHVASEDSVLPGDKVVCTQYSEYSLFNFVTIFSGEQAAVTICVPFLGG